MDTENTSGYSSINTTPQSSDEDLLKTWKWSKTRSPLKPLDLDGTFSEKEEENDEIFEEKAIENSENSTENQENLAGKSEISLENLEISPLNPKKTLENLEKPSENPEIPPKVPQIDGEKSYCPVVTPNEIDVHKEWYHRLITFRMEFNREERGAFPPFPPPPLPSAMIAASCAVSVNSFEEAKRLAITSFQAQSPASIALEKREHRFRPADFRPLPPPHVYLEMIRTLAPHQYIDLTYALAGAVLMDLGFRVPEHYPPLPPKIEPFRDLEAEELAHMTEMSSQSSSGGEYSDASEHSRFIDRLKRRKNRERRAAREVRIAARLLSMGALKEESDAEEPKETFSRESIYKEKTLATFIPRPPPPPPRRPPPSFFYKKKNSRGHHPPPIPPMYLPGPHQIPWNHLHPLNTLWLTAPVLSSMLSPPETPSSPNMEK